MPAQVRLFGSPTYRVAEEWIPLPLDKRGVLLAMLAHVEDGWQRTRLIRLFWPGAGPGQGRVNLRGLLARVRELDGGHGLALAGEQLAWHVDCDSRAFRIAVRDKRWLDAAALAAAPFLQDMESADDHEVSAWIILERKDLTAAYQLAVRRAAEHLAAAGDLPRIGVLWRAAFERDPYDESTMESCLQLALHVGGLAPTALRFNELFDARLQEDYGFAQRDDLAALAQQLRSQAGTRTEHGSGNGAWGGAVMLSPAPWPRQGRHLPAATAPLVRRDSEGAAVTDLFERQGQRAVTIVGPGGIGKTQLALQVARDMAAKAPDGCWFVPLADVEAPELISTAVAQAAGVHPQGQGNVDAQLLAFLRDRVALLVLDNLEQLPGCGEFIDAVLAHCPSLRVLGTSRTPPAVSQGAPYELEGLTYPTESSADGFDDYPAVRLFLLRARQAAVGFALGDSDRQALVSICRSVGGAPLGIELAAAWAGSLALSELAVALQAGGDGLALDVDDAPARHRNLHAAFDHSWRLLGDTERRALAALSVFRGGFTTEAAEHITAAGPSTLAKLLGWYLVRRTGGGRFDLHELVRQFAAQRLAADALTAAAVRRRHAAFYAEMVEREGRWFKGDARQVTALTKVGDELANVRAAWSGACEARDDVALTQFLPMFHVYEIRGLYQEGAEAFARSAAALPRTSVARARSLTAQSVLLGRMGSLRECRATVDESIAILAELGQSDGLTLLHLGVVEFLEGDLDAAVAAWQMCSAAAGTLGDEWSASGAISNLGHVAWRHGDSDGARQLLDMGLTMASRRQDRWSLAMSHVALGELELDQGELALATDHLAEGLSIARSIDQLPMVLKALYLQGAVAKRLGDEDAAVARFRECAGAAKAGGDETMLAAALDELRELAELTR